MANENMIALQTATVGSGGASTIQFTSIPQTYTDLVIHVSARSTASVASNGFLFDIRPNGSSANMTRKSLYGNGSTTTSSSGSDGYNMALNPSDYTAGIFSATEIYIPNYTSSSFKSMITQTASENSGTGVLTLIGTMLWSNTAAISSITLTPLGGNFVEFSSATLYGITAYTGSAGTKAVGGTVTTSGGYTYHTFTSSGNFTPTTSITGAEVLVVAGGGSGGGWDIGGGGGAGGLVYASGQSFSSGTNYAAVVGAGGSRSSGTLGSNGNNSQFHSLTAAVGGGRGGGISGTTNGASGGSGGGGGEANYVTGSGGAGTAGQGNAGGNAGTDTRGGGGGGAGAAGANSNAGGTGGVGSSAYSTWGAATSTGQNSGGTYYYAGGGGAGQYGGLPGAGGLGGGGTGGNASNSGNNALANTGGGGGGTGGGNPANNTGSGGSGVIIVRYAS